MFSDPPILNDFVSPIPCCQSETDLNSILNIFHRWNCQQIAIFQKNGRWGIIDSADLLSLITEVHLNQKTVAHGRFRSSVPQQTIFGLNSQNLNLIVMPAIVCQSGTELSEFLSLLPKGSLSSDRQKYLLVDKSGKLQGKLDKNKISEYLASKYKSNPTKRSSLLEQSNYCLDILDSIPLPLKIETTSGKDLYFNSYWQEIIIDGHHKQHQLKQGQAIASWWLDQQQAKLSNQNSKKAQFEERLENSWKENSFSTLSSSLSSGSVETHTSITSRVETSSELDLKIDIDSVNENQKKLGSESPATQLEIQQIENWNYIKVPLTDINQEYQLVLALEANSSTSLPNIANKLLTTVSHELKSPLTGIVGLSNLLEARKLGQLNQRQTRYVELIHSSGQKMMGIINDLIKLTTLTEKHYSAESEFVDLELLCRQVYNQLVDQLQSLDTSDLEISNNVQLKLDIETSSNIEIAYKPHLSCILIYLMREVTELAKSPEQLEIRISSVSGLIEITIGSTLTAEAASSELNYDINSSLRLAMVEYLTEFIQGNFKSDRSLDSCQFTLLLPVIQSDHLSPQPAAASTTDEIAKRNLTILCLYPEAEAISEGSDNYSSLNCDPKNWLDNSRHQANYHHRIIEADGLEQAHTLARIWQLDVIVLEGHRLSNPLQYLQLLQTSEYLSAIPLITLDNKTTQAANQIESLSVYPCLLSPEHRRVEDLMQVIQIATGV